MKKKLLIAVIAFTLAAGAFAQSASDFTVDANGVITKYTGFDTEVVIPATIGGKKITAIGNEAFRRAELTSVTIPAGVTSIGDAAFADNKIASLTLPGTVKTIGIGAFRNNPIAVVVLPEGVETVGGSAFAGTKCTSVSLPSTLISISKTAVYDEDSFDTSASPSFILAANINVDFGSIGKGYGEDSGAIFLNYIANDRKAGTYAFDIKSERKTAEGYQYYETEHGAVLTGFQDRDATRARIPAEIGGLTVKALYGTYSGKSNIVAVQIPESVTYIGRAAFYNCRLENVTIPGGVTYIGDDAFRSNKLTSVTIPAGVTYVSGFYGNQLTSVTIPNRVIHIGNGAFQSNQLTSVTIPNRVIHIGNGAFSGNKLTSVTIPANVTSIGNNAFSDPLTSVTFERAGVTFRAGFPNIPYSTSLETVYASGGAGRYVRNGHSGDWAKAR